MTTGSVSPSPARPSFHVTDTVYGLLVRNPLLGALPDSEHRRLATHLTTIDRDKDELLFREGDPSGHFFIVIQGRIEIVKALGTPEQSTLGIRGAGEFVGEMGLLNPDRRRTATVRAMEPSQLLKVPFVEFDRLLSRYPILAHRLATTLSAWLTEGHDTKIRELREKNQELERALRELQLAQDELIEKHQLERELDLARNIQQSILPVHLPELYGYEFGALMIPARAVGGDFFGLFPLDEQHMAFLIGDVMGKGIPSAIFMAQTQALFRATAQVEDAPSETLQKVNRLLLKMNGAGLFVTAIYGILNGSTGIIDYARAGHEIPLLLDEFGSSEFIAQGEGSPLGILDNPVFDENRLCLFKGQTLLLYSDGVTDATNSADEFFEPSGLKSAMLASAGASAQELCESVLRAIKAFKADMPQSDDITLLSVRRN